MTDMGYGLMLNDGQGNGNGCNGIDKKTVNVNECIMSGIQHASLWTYNCNKETDESLGSACIHDLAGWLYTLALDMSPTRYYSNCTSLPNLNLSLRTLCNFCNTIITSSSHPIMIQNRFLHPTSFHPCATRSRRPTESKQEPSIHPSSHARLSFNMLKGNCFYFLPFLRLGTTLKPAACMPASPSRG